MTMTNPPMIFSPPNDSSKVVPDLPLFCLQTAEFTSIGKVVSNKNTVIDFWTTTCTRCPDALDQLDKLAASTATATATINDDEPIKRDNNTAIQFISICCDKMDGAREIIEKDDVVRWQNIRHYYMSKHDKEEAKKVLGFATVPFYVVVNKNGDIIQIGNKKKINFDDLLLLQQQQQGTPTSLSHHNPLTMKSRVIENMNALDHTEGTETSTNATTVVSPDNSMEEIEDAPPVAVEVERVFVIDDFDF